MGEHWLVLIEGEKAMEITRDDVKLLDLVPCAKLAKIVWLIVSFGEAVILER